MFWAAAAALLASSGGCSKGECDSRGLAEPVVTVTNAATGEAVCDATVVALLPGDALPPAEASNAPLQPFLPADAGGAPADAAATACVYVGFFFGDPAFANTPISIRVSKMGFQTATATIESQWFSCMENPPSAQSVNIALEPGGP